MPQIQDRLVEMKNADGTFRGLLDYRDGRVYDRSGKHLETIAVGDDDVSHGMSDFAYELDCSHLAWARRKPVKMTDRQGEERVVTMDLAQGDVHVDAIGSQFMGGYQLAPGIADIAAPVIVTPKASNKYPVWDAPNTFRRVLNVGNAPSGQVPEISPTLSTTAYQTVEYALATFVPTEVEANADAPLAPRRAAVKRLYDALKLEREIRVINLLQTSGNWNSNNVLTVAAASKWNGGPSSNPIADLQVILQKSAMPVTRFAWAEIVDQAFGLNAQVQAKIYAKAMVPAIPSGDDWSKVLKLPPISMSQMKYMASGTALSYAWGNHVVAFHEAGNVGIDDIATAKTFRWTGNPETPDGQIQSGGWLYREFFDNRRGGRGGVMGVLVHNDAEVMTSNIVGGLILNAYQ
jgi:hypothetical protein